MKTIEPKIAAIAEKKLIGQKLSMSLIENRTGELWRSFKPRRKEIQNNLNADLISLQIYPSSYKFDPNREFEKWAAVEVKDFSEIPEGMETLVLKEGLYAVFYYKGSSTDTRIFQHIFETWLPQSGYELDNRPHFEVLGEKYRNNDPESEEDIYIPIKVVSL
jgi:AraC family transcriptional regulator